MFIKNKINRHNVLLIVLLAFSLSLICRNALGIEKKPKITSKVQPKRVELAINDSNLDSSIKTAIDLVKKNEMQSALNILLKTYDFTKSVLTTINLLQKQYGKIVDDPKTSLGDKEYLIIKLNRMEDLVSTYKKSKEISAYYIGYIYTKWGDTERARKYLFEVLESTPFDLKKDSMWMKAKSLLLEAYNLEGEL